MRNKDIYVADLVAVLCCYALSAKQTHPSLYVVVISQTKLSSDIQVCCSNMHASKSCKRQHNLQKRKHMYSDTEAAKNQCLQCTTPKARNQRSGYPTTFWMTLRCFL